MNVTVVYTVTGIPGFPKVPEVIKLTATANLCTYCCTYFYVVLLLNVKGYPANTNVFTCKIYMICLSSFSANNFFTLNFSCFQHTKKYKIMLYRFYKLKTSLGKCKKCSNSYLIVVLTLEYVLLKKTSGG